MTVLIAYGTVEGQTGKIARFASDVVRSLGLETVFLDTTDISNRIAWSDIDHVILAGSVHQRRHPKEFEVFVAAHRKELEKRATLFLSVSLSAAFAEGLEDAKEYAEEMMMRTNLSPTKKMLVAGAIKASKYDFFATQVLRHVVLRGRNYDPAIEEHEFTDWKSLEAAISDFVLVEGQLSGQNPSL